MKIWLTKSGYRIIQILSGRSNVFLLTNGERNILIDTSPKFMWNILKKRLNKLNVNIIDYLILTHAHFDHAGNAKSIREKYKAQVIIHVNEASYLASGKNVLLDGTNFFTRFIVKILAKNFLSGSGYEPCQYDLSVDKVFNLKDIGFNGYIIHTPGHTIGSVSIIIEDEIALVGDTMFGVFRGSVLPPFADDIDQLIISWRKLLETKCLFFIPSHGTAIDRSLVQKDYTKRIRRKNLHSV